MQKTQGILEEKGQAIKPREKLLAFGINSLREEELLALLLGSGQKRHSVFQIAAAVSQLLQEFPETGNSRQFRQQQKLLLKELLAVKGVGLVAAARLLASLELGRRHHKQTIQKLDSPAKVFPFCTEIADKNREYCLALYLNGQDEFIDKQILAIGGLNFTFLELRHLFEIAFQLEATSVVLAHNHPSGQLHPSTEDRILTEKMIQICHWMGLHFLDHLVVSKQHYYSFRQQQPELFQD